MMNYQPEHLPSKPFESQFACLPQPDIFEEMVLLGRLGVQVSFGGSAGPTAIRTAVYLKIPGFHYPVERWFFLAERDLFATWLRKSRLRIERALRARNLP
jgi:hypothetical protein